MKADKKNLSQPGVLGRCGVWGGGGTGDFYGGEHTVCDTIIMDVRQYTSVQAAECTTARGALM